MAELQIKNLHVTAADKQILKGVGLHVRAGEFHALMGPNGSGKSTLANAIMGHPNLEVTEGQILFDGEDITEADPDERARAGLFMAFQYPVAIPGVTVAKYLRMVINAHREGRGEQAISLKDFRKTVEAAMQLTQVPKEFSSRYLNDGFSGGEKKRMEILQLALTRPRLAVLDETDSGLDIDALNTVAAGVNTVSEGSDMGILIITHYQRILHMVKPQFVHIMFEGRIVKEGGPELVATLEEKGYGWIREEVAAAAGCRWRFPLRRSFRSSHARAWCTSTRPPRRRPCGRRSRRWTATTRPTGPRSTAACTRSPPRRRTPMRTRASWSRSSSGRSRARPSSPATRPRPSTSWRTRGAARTSGRTTSWSSPRWSTTPTSSRGSCSAAGWRTSRWDRTGCST